MTLVSVEGFRTLKKDMTTGGVVNTDTSSYESYMVSKRLAQRTIQQQQEAHNAVTDLQNEINNIKGDLTDIRTMLVQLLQKGN
jgi:hypothetical protein